jgi:hypothetical protein
MSAMLVFPWHRLGSNQTHATLPFIPGLKRHQHTEFAEWPLSGGGADGAEAGGGGEDGTVLSTFCDAPLAPCGNSLGIMAPHAYEWPDVMPVSAADSPPACAGAPRHYFDPHHCERRMATQNTGRFREWQVGRRQSARSNADLFSRSGVR